MVVSDLVHAVGVVALATCELNAALVADEGGLAPFENFFLYRIFWFPCTHTVRYRSFYSIDFESYFRLLRIYDCTDKGPCSDQKI